MLALLLACAPTTPDAEPPADTGTIVATLADSGDSAIDSGGDTAPPPPEEACNGLDDDGDGEVDEGVTVSSYADADGDGFGDDATVVTSCEPGPTAGGDCDDGDAAVHPGADDACGDAVDADCDGNDPACGAFAGDYDDRDADVAVWGPAHADAGRLLAVGDANGDGAVDLLVGEMDASGAQLAYGPLTVDARIAAYGPALTTSGAMGGGGRSLAVGDIDGDGVGDVGVGAAWGSPGGLFFALGPVAADVDLAAADVALVGEDDTWAGHGCALADVDGDGLLDALVGAHGADDAAEDAGAVYVVRGPVGDADLATDADATLLGESAQDHAGRAVAAGEDVDGDGLGDLLVPAYYASASAPGAGAAYVVYGPVSGTFDLGDADGRLLGETPEGLAGIAVAQGDVDGDGLADAVVGSLDASAGTWAGAAYVVGGPAAGDRDLGAADWLVRGDAAYEMLGGSVAVGDVDEDGRADLLVGAEAWSDVAADAGAAFLFLAPAPGAWIAADADAAFLGTAEGDRAGAGVAFGDLDADGLLDVLVGAPEEATGGYGAGAVYLFANPA